MRLGLVEIKWSCRRYHREWLRQYMAQKRLNPDKHPERGHDFLHCQHCGAVLYDERICSRRVVPEPE